MEGNTEISGEIIRVHESPLIQGYVLSWQERPRVVSAIDNLTLPGETEARGGYSSGGQS